MSDNAHEEIDDDLFFPDHRRALARKSVLWPAFIHINDHKIPCQIRNLSIGGMRIKLDLPFHDGVNAIIEIPRYGFKLDARVAWQSDGFFGMQFLAAPDTVREQFNEGAAIVGVDAIRLMKALG